jgi:hypothetical protein
MAIITVAASLAACGQQSGDAGLSKADARDGKADGAGDVCDRYGWYDDDECDDFCPRPDPDCGGCPDVLCALYCEDGFETDQDGCEICQCREPQECPEVLCALYCEDGFETDDDGCEICKCREPEGCPDVMCAMHCENGFETDDYGCAICECREPEECPEMLCALYCEDGFETDQDGCDICQCREPEGCPDVMCAMHCENGFETDEDGCAICECREENDPGCIFDGCPTGQACRNCWDAWICVDQEDFCL